MFAKDKHLMTFSDFQDLGCCQFHAGQYKFPKILIFAWKLNYYHWPQTLSAFPFKWQAHLGWLTFPVFPRLRGYWETTSVSELRPGKVLSLSFMRKYLSTKVRVPVACQSLVFHDIRISLSWQLKASSMLFP